MIEKFRRFSILTTTCCLMPDSHYRWSGPDLILEVRLSPKASRDQVQGLHDGRIKIAITAPPVDGKANKHLVKYLARLCSVSPSQVDFVSGLASRNKTIRIVAPRAIDSSLKVEPPPSGR